MDVDCLFLSALIALIPVAEPCTLGTIFWITKLRPEWEALGPLINITNVRQSLVHVTQFSVATSWGYQQFLCFLDLCRALIPRI